MEPRPPSKPTRPATPVPAPTPSYAPPAHPSPGGERPAWGQPAAGPAAAGAPYPERAARAAYAAPPAPAYVPPTEVAATAPWAEPVGGEPPGPVGPGYSPGPALRPIDGGGARWLGPLLALVILAAVVGSAIFFVVRFVGGDDDPRGPAAAGSSTTQVAAAAASPTVSVTATRSGAESTAEPDQTAPADETAAEPTRAAAAGADPTRTPTTTAKRTPTTARQMLPTSDDLPAGFERTEDDKRTRDEVAASFADPAEALANLDDWDWRENAYRTFENTNANVDPSDTSYINVSIHRFGEKTGTAKATTYFANAVIEGQGLEEIEVDPLGDQTIALRGAPEGVNLVVLYIREGNYLIRIGGSSPEGDPTDMIIKVAKEILKK